MISQTQSISIMSIQIEFSVGYNSTPCGCLKRVITIKIDFIVSCKIMWDVVWIEQKFVFG